MNSQDNGLSLLSFKLVYKVMLIAGLIVVCITAILNYFFIQDLAEPRISQVEELANTTSIVVSELALASFYDRKQDRINNALNSSINELNTQGGGFLQISVILFPSGIYYASTNSELINKKVGQSLLRKLEKNEEAKTTVEKLNYEFDNRTVPVLHFLRNIVVEQNGVHQRVAVTQILFDYSRILNKTRKTLILVSGVFLICMITYIWVLYLPITKLHKKMIDGFIQISNKNFDFKLKTRDQSEIGVLFDTFNKMTNQLKNYFQDRQKTKINSVISSLEGAAGIPKELALRKSDITCLCARIPDVKDMIEGKTPEAVAEAITKFVEPLEAVVKEFGGQVIKILGDKVYVLFEGINGIDNSIRTALKINQKWQVINHERKVLNRKKFDFGIGLHSAEGVAGTIGHHSVSYTIVGKAASIAEYLCTCAKPEEILVSTSLMDKTSGSFPHQVLGAIEPIDLGETEQVLILTNLHYLDDSAVRSGAKIPLGFSGSDSDRGLGNITGLIGTSNHESSIPDMLEETLSNAPLDPVAFPIVSDKKGQPKKKDKIPEKKTYLDKKQSLWEDFE